MAYIMRHVLVCENHIVNNNNSIYDDEQSWNFWDNSNCKDIKHYFLNRRKSSLPYTSPSGCTYIWTV